MRKLYLLASVLALSTLTGCATLSAGLSVAQDQICLNQDAIRDRVQREMAEAVLIVDPVEQAATLAALTLTLAALDRC